MRIRILCLTCTTVAFVTGALFSSSACAAQAQAGQRVRLEIGGRVGQIGRDSGAPTDEFEEITSVTTDSLGRVVILDSRLGALRVFDSTGAFQFQAAGGRSLLGPTPAGVQAVGRNLEV